MNAQILTDISPSEGPCPHRMLGAALSAVPLSAAGPGTPEEPRKVPVGAEAASICQLHYLQGRGVVL